MSNDEMIYLHGNPLYIYISVTKPFISTLLIICPWLLVNVPIDVASKQDDVATSAERGICRTLFVHKAMWKSSCFTPAKGKFDEFSMEFIWILYGFLDDGFFQISFSYIICLTVCDVNKSDMSKDIHVVTFFNILSQYIDVE